MASPRRRALTAAGVVMASAVLTGTSVSVAAGTTAAASVYVDPAWSPRGTSIAFAEQRTTDEGETVGALRVMRADGSGNRILIPEERGGIGWPSWSPDGKRLAFDARCSIHVVNANGTGRRNLLSRFDGCGLYPDWSPGGRKIAYARALGDTDAGNIMVMNPDGSRKTLAAVSDGTFAAYTMPTWSPDGERLAFRRVDAPDSANHATPSLDYIQQYGGPIRSLSQTDANDPDWSPDGRKILFAVGVEQRPTIRVLNLRTGRATSLHSGSHPRWSPDGRRIAFTDEGHIYVMNANGSGAKQLTT